MRLELVSRYLDTKPVSVIGPSVMNKTFLDTEFTASQ